jgi:ADP-ribose pyrophosphatase YjhB (NUDIX family)
VAVSNNAVARVLLPYLEAHPAEVERLRPLALACVVGSDPVTASTTFPAHVTCATVAARSDGRVLQLRHPVTRRWTLPWGHVDAADGSLLAGALRELCAQTGLQEGTLIPGSAEPIDVDSYVTPDGELCGDSPRVHFQIIYSVIVPEVGRLRPVTTSATRWTSLDDLPDRLAEKVRAGRFPVDLPQ